MESLVIQVKNIWEAERIINYFPRSYRSTDPKGLIVVIPCSDTLAYAKEAAGFVGGTVRAYGIDSKGISYSLLKREQEQTLAKV